MFAKVGLCWMLVSFIILLAFLLPRIAHAADLDETVRGNNARFKECCANITALPGDLQLDVCDYDKMSQLLLLYLYYGAAADGEFSTQAKQLEKLNSTLGEDAELRNAYHKCLTNGRDLSTGCCKVLNDPLGLRNECLYWCNGSANTFDLEMCPLTTDNFNSLAGVYGCFFVKVGNPLCNGQVVASDLDIYRMNALGCTRYWKTAVLCAIKGGQLED